MSLEHKEFTVMEKIPSDVWWIIFKYVMTPLNCNCAPSFYFLNWCGLRCINILDQDSQKELMLLCLVCKLWNKVIKKRTVRSKSWAHYYNLYTK